MRRVAVVLASWACAAVVATGCSLLGLDRFDFPGCVEMRCEALNNRDGIPDDACELWQCSDDLEDCEFGGRDADRDDAIDAACVVDGIPGTDCDDAEPNARPGNDEICNGADDDCNGLIDDGTPVEAADPIVVSTSPLDVPAHDPWTSVAPADAGLVVVTELIGRAMVGGLLADDVPMTVSGPLTLATGEAAFSSSGAVAGCSKRLVEPAVVREPCTTDADCTRTSRTRCVTDDTPTSFCEVPVMPRTPMMPGDCTAHWECDDGDPCNGEERCEPTASPTLIDARGCRAPPAPGCDEDEVCDAVAGTCTSFPVETCSPLDLALAPMGDDEWLVATSAFSGCLGGTLRFGHFVLGDDRGMPTRYPVATITARGPDARSTVWTGVDAVADCTGESRPAGAPEGAVGVGLAALPADDLRLRPQALAGFLAAPSCRRTGGCVGTPVGMTGPVAVEVVGVWLEEGLAGSSPAAWVNGASDGAPTALGIDASAAAMRVAVASFDAEDGDGYLVAYPADGGGVAVHFLPALPSPFPICETPPVFPCLGEASPHATQFSTSSMRPRSMPPALPAPDSSTMFASASPTGDVAITVRVVPGGPARAYFAWPEDGGVVVTAADLDTATGALSGEEMLTSAPSTGAREVSVTHVPEGIALEGATVGGSVVAPADRGGLVVVWRDGSGVRGVRISDHTGAPVGGVARLGAPATSPHAFLGSSSEVRVVARDGADLVVFPAVCGP